MTDQHPTLDSFMDLPSGGSAIFQIGDALVQFSSREEYGRVSGWVVTTAEPGYEGFLHAGRQTDWTQTGPEVMRTYEFEFRGLGDDSRTFTSSGPTDVTVDEFRRFYFGADR